MVPKRQRPTKLKPSNAKLKAFGGHPIPVLGKHFLRCVYQGLTHVYEFHVVETGTSLLGCTSCKRMRLVTFNNIEQISNEMGSLSGLTSDQIFAKYVHCFEGLGQISEPYHIKIDPTITPCLSSR